MKYFTVFFSYLILIFFTTPGIYPEETESNPLEPPETALPEEAPATVWDIDIGDTNVDLYIAGYWKIGILGGVSVQWTPSGVIFPATFPGLSQFQFYQEPDLTISLWIMNKFYLETSFLEGFDKNTYAIGYRGEEGEILQSVRIGNSDIKIDDYKGLNVPAPKYNTPGISALFQTPVSSHDILFRYDPSSENKKVFLGENEISEEVIRITDFDRGHFFILPESDLDLIEVYIADKDGIYTGTGSDTKTYRSASDNEARYSLVDGTVTLKESAETDVLVYYEKGGVAVGNSLIPISDFIVPMVNGEPDPDGASKPFNWVSTDTWYPSFANYGESSSVTVNGRKSLRVYNPLKLGPFEYYNHYIISSNLPQDKWKTTIVLADNSLLETEDSDNYQYEIDIDNRILTVFNNNDTDIRSPWSRYPLADSYPQTYGGEDSGPELTGRSFLLSIQTSNGLSLGTGVIPGSERVYINGYETNSTTIDYSSGAISFNRYIFPQDRIEIIYRTETTDMAGGDLLFAQGNRFYPADNLELYLGEMFRWNISQNPSSTVDTTAPGGLTIAGGVKYGIENFNIELTSTFNLQTPNTTGYLRVLGMEENGYIFSVGETLLKESPQEKWSTVTAVARADLLYRDYFSTNDLGQYFLNSYDWTSEVIDSSKQGPSVAGKASDDSFDGNVMVLQYDLAGNEWSSGDLLLSADGPIDLSRFSSFSIGLKKLDTSGTITAKILIGETGETEDWNDDGFVSDEDKSLIVEIDLTLPSSEDTWTAFTYDFSPSEMRKLTKCRSVRVLVEDDGTAASGRLLLTNFYFEGTVFDYRLYDSGNNEISSDDKLNISEIGNTEAYNLATKYPDVRDIFHPDGEDQKAVRVEWGSPTPILTSDYWEMETHTSPVSPDSYENVNFYVKNDSTGGNYVITLSDSSGDGYSFSYTPGSTDWEKKTLSLTDGSVTDDEGNIISTATIDPAIGKLTRFHIKGTGTTSGEMYLDELYFSEPTFSMDGNVELVTEYSYPGDIWTTSGGFPILANFSVENQFRYNGSSVISTASEGINSIQNSTSLSIELAMLSISGNMKVDWDQTQTIFSGSHELKFPADFPYGYISDSYSRYGSGSTATMTRESKLRFNIPNTGNLEFSVKSEGIDESFLQSWHGETKWSVASIFNIDASLMFDQNSAWDNRDNNNYFSNWINDYSMIIPETDSVITRSVKSTIAIELLTKPVGFTLTPDLSFENNNIPFSEQINRGGFIMTIPVVLFDGTKNKLTITPSYSRSFIQKTSVGASNSFSNGFNNLFSDLNKWLPLTSFIPFYELFATSTVSKFYEKTLLFNEAEYTPDFGLSISRKFGSKLYDLFLPYNFTVHFIRLFEKLGDSYSNSNTFEFSFKQTAINLFGSFGVYGKSELYTTDEFSSSLQFNLSVDGGNIPVPKELIYQNYISFYGKKNGVLSIENKFETDFTNTNISDTLDFKFQFQMPMRKKFRLKFLNSLIKKEHFWSHEENLGINFQYPWESNDEIDNTIITINVKHLSKLNVPGLGALKGWIKLGFIEEYELFIAGFEAGIELEVSF